MDEAGELVTREQGFLQHRVSFNRQMLGMREDGLDQLLGVALLAEDRRAILRMLVERGVHLVVEVVEECRGAPVLLVLAEMPRVPGHRGLDRQGMAAERLALRIARERLPRALSSHIHRAD
jgi:hypothetical protein